MRCRTLTSAWIETSTKIHLYPYAVGRTLTSAWIETGLLPLLPLVYQRRTLTSAWIETALLGALRTIRTVALSRVRGLKHENFCKIQHGRSRTLTSAWIETSSSGRGIGGVEVALSRVRGLKPLFPFSAFRKVTSHSHECVD